MTEKHDSRIEKAFENTKAFIPYVCCGYPDMETSRAIIEDLAASGADIIELGIPFSDPTAEGPVIMNASKIALDNGCTTDLVFEMVKDLRKSVQTPFVIMTYANVVFGYGIERFLDKAAKAGIDGLILPDVPFEEKEEFSASCKNHGIDFISMIAPTSKERIAAIASDATGFLYIVSSLGVTGTRSNITTDIDSIVKEVRKYTDIPCAVGFGISAPKQAAYMASLSDGAIVGSALIKTIEQNGPAAAGELARSMIDAVKQQAKS